MRDRLLLLTALAVLAAVNFGIYQREALLRTGRTLLLELAPVDPRSLMQGDYMALRFRLQNDAFAQKDLRTLGDGHLVLRLDEQGIGHFVRFADSSPAEASEILLRYRIRNARPRLATDAFFFQEGQAKLFEGARYGEFRAAKDGEAILTRLRDGELRVLGEGR